MPFFNISLSGNQDIGVLNEVNIGMIKNMLINLSDFASHGNHGARIKIVVRGKGPGPEVVLLDGYDYTYDSLDVIKIPDPRGKGDKFLPFVIAFVVIHQKSIKAYLKAEKSAKEILKNNLKSMYSRFHNEHIKDNKNKLKKLADEMVLSGNIL